MDQRSDTATGFPLVDPPSEQARSRARARQESLVKPAGSLGRLEELGSWLAACQGTCPPRGLSTVRVVVFAAEHGIAARGVSAYPPEATDQLVRAVRTGGTAIDVLADVAGASVRVADLDTDTSGAIDVEDALSAEATTAAIRAGADIADAEVDSGTDLLVPATIGVASSTPAAVLVAALTTAEPVAVVGRGSGIDDYAWMRKTRAVRDALRRARPVRTDPLALLRTVGGVDLAALAGFLAQAAARRTPVLLDGLTSAAAALVAERLAPGARAWWAAAHRSGEPAHARALNELELAPVLDLGITLEQGAAAATALPLLRMAARILAEMRTHDEAGVTPPG